MAKKYVVLQWGPSKGAVNGLWKCDELYRGDWFIAALFYMCRAKRTGIGYVEIKWRLPNVE